MSDQLKFIVTELEKEPFSKHYNLITFDSLESVQLLQVLTDVFAGIDPKQKADVREEPADQTAIRIFSTLRILNYRPPTDQKALADFRQGVVQGDKHVIHPILEWILRRVPELKERAYLAKYLVKVDVPADFMADSKIAELYDQYTDMIRAFTETHKQYTAVKNSGFNTADIKKDIASMEDEKDQLIKRVERLKKRVEAAPNSGPMLTAARDLRVEMDREELLARQKQEQRNLLIQLNQRTQRLQQQVRDAKQAGIGTTPAGLMQSLEEEVRVNTYLVKEKLPSELESRRKHVMELQSLVSEPAMGHADLEGINRKIRDLNSEVNQLVEKKMMRSDPADDKLSLFKQQASIRHRKKESAAEGLREVRDELSKAEAVYAEKKKLVKPGEGEEILRGDEFKRYVSKLRSKNTVYKEKRQDISELRAEAGVLTRTEEILQQRYGKIDDKLSALEKKKGVSGFRETQDALESVSALKSEQDELKGKTLDEMSHMVHQLNSRIASKKDSLAPIIKELRPLRQQAQEVEAEHSERKTSYDSLIAGLESNRSALEQEVRAYHEEISAEESRYHYMVYIINMLQQQQNVINNESKSYTSNDSGDKKKSLREVYSKKIQEQETAGKTLRDRQRNLRDNQDGSVKQVKMWKDIERLLQAKQEKELTSRSRDHYDSSERFGRRERDDMGDRLVI